MQMSDLKPASSFARQYGVKSVLYGKPGGGKTPIAATTSPKPVLLLTEPGALTLRGQVNKYTGADIPAWEAFTPERIDEFFKWLKESAETKNFHTVIVDSASQMMEIYLDKQLSKPTSSGNKAFGEAAYGEAAKQTMKHLNDMYFMKEKHCVVICKRAVVKDMGVDYARPIFAGRDLNARVPHLFDLIMQIGVFPAVAAFPTLQCNETFDAMARDRSGQLAPYETADFNHIFTKCMQAVPA